MPVFHELSFYFSTFVNWDAVAVFVALGALAVSYQAARLSYQTAQVQKLTAAASILTTMSLAFDSQDMRRRRIESARKFLDRDNRATLDICDSESVLDFLEEVAYFTHRGVLDTEMAWNHFSWHLERYYQAARDLAVPCEEKRTDLIAMARTLHGSESLYTEIEWLHDQMKEERIKSGDKNGEKVLTEEHVRKFLTKETQLSLGIVPAPAATAQLIASTAVSTRSPRKKPKGEGK